MCTRAVVFFAIVAALFSSRVAAGDPATQKAEQRRAAEARNSEGRRAGGAVPIPEKGGGPPADFADERYGPYARNVFDLWQVEARKPTPLLIFIHGGGFSQGDKRGYWTKTQTAALNAGLAFASVNYRLSSPVSRADARLRPGRAIHPA